MASLNTHQKIKSDFKTLQIINKPKLSELLAEFLGILFGDGHLSEYQVSITTNTATDKKHAIFIKSLIRKLFQITPTLKIRKNDNKAVVVASSKMLVNILNNLGMPTGNKIQNHLTAPRWIFKNKSYQKAFLRGLFDTDGCIYLDKHQKNNYLGWTITSYANNLVNDIIIILKELHFSPTHRTTQKSIFLRRQEEIMRYFTEIGTSNPKHYNRYKKYIGRVPKRS